MPANLLFVRKQALGKKQMAILSLMGATLLLASFWIGSQHVHSAPNGLVRALAPPPPVPEVKLVDVPAQALIGEKFKFKITFDNVATTGDSVGYAPFIDVLLPTFGTDGNVGGPCDGISFVSAEMVGVYGGPLPITNYLRPTTPCGSFSSPVTHPFFASGMSPVTVPPGGQLITFELPFGSFEPDQPAIVIEVTVSLHNYADVGTPLTMYTRGGFRYGATEFNDWSTDPPILTHAGNPATDGGNPSNSANWEEKATVTPQVFSVSKSYLGPEGEAVSGTNFVGYYPLRYQIAVNIADQQAGSGLQINDCLQTNMTFVGVVAGASTPGYTSSFVAPCLNMSYGTVIGTAASPDIVITYEFYISQFVANTKDPVLDPDSCINTTSTNKANASGMWMPLDPRDQGTGSLAVGGGTTYVLSDKHIAIQKSVTVKTEKNNQFVDKAGPTVPGDYLEYSLKFQVSDYFTFGDIEIDDKLSDGQMLIAAPPLLRVTDGFGTTQGKFNSIATNLDFEFKPDKESECQGVIGGTRLKFQVSRAMINLASFLRHNQGIMTGGYAFPFSPPVAAEGEILFYVQIQDEFTHQGKTDKKYVDKHDPMNNCVTISAQMYQNSKDKIVKPLKGKDVVCSDNSLTSVSIAGDYLEKTIIARNGKGIPVPSSSPSPAPPEFAANDVITFSITKTIPSGDWENLTVQDWVPLPALDVTQLTAASLASFPVCSGFPAAGAICRGPNDNVGPPAQGAAINSPNIDNSLTLDYGTAFNTLNTPKTIEVWFSLTMTNKPFADGLFFTNEVQECEFNTFGKKFCQVAVAQFELTEPNVRIRKGIIASSNPHSAIFFNPAGSPQPHLPANVSVTALTTMGGSCPPGACSPVWTNSSPPINSTSINSNPNIFNADLYDADAGDWITYAIVLENRGSGLNGAFDIRVKDSPALPALRPGFAPPPSTWNIRAHDGTGTPAFTLLPTGVLALLTNTGKEFVDPGPSLLKPGGLDPFDPTNGRNLAILTYNMRLAPMLPNQPSNIKIGGCYDNTAELLNYASVEGGPNFVGALPGPTPPITDKAKVCINPTLEKSVVGTSEQSTMPQVSVVPQTTANTPQVTIGEIVRFRLVVRLPEGDGPNFQITDALPPGMKFLNDGTARVAFISNQLPALRITHSLGSAFNVLGNESSLTGLTLGPSKTIASSLISVGSGCGDDPTFSLGNVRNNNNDNDLEFIVLEFNALVCNQSFNQNGSVLKNSFTVSVDGSQVGIPSNEVSVTIVEPQLDVQKAFSPIGANGVSTVTVSIKNVGTSTAFEVQMSDPLPNGLVLYPTPAPAVSVSPPGCAQPIISVSGNGVTMSAASMLVNCTVTVSFPVYVCSHCVTNKADVTYTSLPGLGTPTANPNNTTGSVPPCNPASTLPPCSPVSECCERQYSNSGQASINDGCPTDVGSLTVTKVITSAPPLVPPATAAFPVTVSCSPSGPNVNFTLTAALPTHTVNNIPVNSTCTVTEGPLPPPIAHPVCPSVQWATPTYSPGQTVTIPSTGGVQTVTITNHYFCNTPATCVTPPLGMVSWWPLNETSGTTTVDIMDGNNGSTRNSAGVVTPVAVFGGPASINGQHVGDSLNFITSYVDVPNAANLNFGTGEFSIDAWVRVIPGATASSGPTVQAIVDKTVQLPGVPRVAGYALFVHHPVGSTAGRLGFVIDDGLTPPAVSSPLFHSTLLPSGWHHVAVSVARTSTTSANVTLYVDGVASPSMTVAVGNTSNTSSLLMARSRLLALMHSGFREVALDEIEIFNRAVTAADIQNIFNAGKKGKCTATIKGVKYNDLNGNGVRDAGEPGLANWTINVTDQNNNTHTLTTDAQGNYSFTVPAPASYTVSEVLQSGWMQTGPASGTYPVTVSPGQVVSNRDFGNKKRDETSGCATPPPGMVAWWPLDEANGATVVNDIAGFNNQGVPKPGGQVGISGGPSTITGKILGALFFAGPYIEVPPQAELDFGSRDFSIDAWVRPVDCSHGGGGIRSPIVDKFNGTTGFLFYLDQPNVGVANLYLNINGPTFVSTGTIPTLGSSTWSHVAVTVTRPLIGPAVGTFYINGLAAGTFTPPPGNVTNTLPLWIGKTRIGGSCEIAIDEIELFNTALSPTDINSIFQADKKGKCKAIIAGVKFEDSNGNGVRDSGEPGLANWTIKVTDQNNNIHTLTTDAQGNYSFTVPAPANYTVSEVLQSGWTQTAPSSGSYLVSVAANQSVNLVFGNKKAGASKCDLVIKKEVKPNPLISGQTAQVIVTVTNIGNQPCHGPTTVTESMPPVSAGGPGWNCVGAVCTYPQAIMGGQTVSVTYNYNITAAPGTVIKNCAGVKNGEDSNTTNNEACVEVKVDERKSPDLSIVKTAQCVITLIGMRCKIGFTITNNGPGSFTGILVIQDVISPTPSALAFPSGSGNPPGWNCAVNLPANVGCSGTSPVTLSPGASTSFSLEVIVPTGEYKNCANVKGFAQAPFTAANMVHEGDFNNNESCANMSRQPDSLVWAMNLGVNARVNSEITIRNSCREEHAFAVTPRNLPFLRLLDKSEVKVRGGNVEKLKVLFDAAGMRSGTYEGVVEITCVTCQKDAACKQDRQTVPVRLTVTPTARSSGTQAPDQNRTGFLRLGPTFFSVLAEILVTIITM